MIGEFVRGQHKLRKINAGKDAIESGMRMFLLFAGIPLLVDLGVLGYGF
jgi:hypothetical protein